MLHNSRPDEGPSERHEERGGNALVRDIRDEEAKQFAGKFEYIIEIAAHLSGSLPARGKLPACELRQGLRNEGLLDLACQLHFGLQTFAHHHLFLKQIVLNGKRGLLRDAGNDLQPAGAET